MLRTTLAPPPKDVYLIVNSKCNAKCIMCDVGLGINTTFSNIMTKYGEMDLQIIKKTINDLWWKPKIRITSTEPLLYSKIDTAVRLYKKNNFFVSITTNGILLDKYIEKIIQWNLDEIIVSLHGPPLINDKIFQIKVTDKIVASLKNLNKFRSKSLKIGINTVIMPINQNYIYETVNLYRDYVDFYILSHLNFVSEACAKKHNKLFPKYSMSPSTVYGINPQEVDPEKLHYELKRTVMDFDVIIIPKIYDKDSLFIYYKVPEKPLNKNQKCQVPWQCSQIAPTGDVLVSTRCFNISMGNIKNQSFLSIWNGKLLREFRKDLLYFKFFPVCNRCCGVF